MLRDLERFEDAEQSYLKAISLRPGYVEAMCNLVLAYKDLKKFDEGLALVDKILRLKPDCADAYCYADSDIAFIRPFDAGTLWQGEQLRFQRETRRGEMLDSRRYKNWYSMAAKYCNVPDQNAITGAYIAQLNTMKHSAMLALMRHIERVHGRSWMEVLLGTWDFSEYILYGAFVEHVLAGEGHFIPPKLLCHSSWYHDIAHLKDLPAFMDLIDDDHVAIHIQSNLKMNIGDYRHLLP